jgi:conjugal transfer pilus assembly protein TraW
MKKYMILLALGATHLQAEMKDLGVFGETFHVIEKNIIEVLQQKMQSEQGQQMLKAFEDKLKAASKSESVQPKAVERVTLATQHRSYLFDPSIALSHDLSDHEGTRFYNAGTQLNPLDHMTLSKRYVFIDGRRPRHVEWAKKLHLEKETMIILVNGNPTDLMKEHSIQLFFDQEGLMVNRFKLSHVPCLVEQEYKKLRITEFTEEELSK